MKRITFAALAAAGLVGSVGAQTTRLDVELSQDGVNWSHDLSPYPMPGSSHALVLVRFVVSWEPGGGVPEPLGLASLQFQPVLASFGDFDHSILPFANTGNNTNGGSIDIEGNGNDLDGPYGRIKPFAATGPSTSQFYAVHSQTVSGLNYLRVARNDITSWVGQGPTTGVGAINNFNGRGGVACVQKGVGFAQPGIDPPFRSGTTGIVVLQLGLSVETFAGPGGVMFLQVTAPLEGITRNTATGAREAAWFRDAQDNAGSITAPVVVYPASMMTPAPGAWLVLGAWGLIGGRRRRPRSDRQRLSA